MAAHFDNYILTNSPGEFLWAAQYEIRVPVDDSDFWVDISSKRLIGCADTRWNKIPAGIKWDTPLTDSQLLMIPPKGFLTQPQRLWIHPSAALRAEKKGVLKIERVENGIDWDKTTVDVMRLRLPGVVIEAKNSNGPGMEYHIHALPGVDLPRSMCLYAKFVHTEEKVREVEAKLIELWRAYYE